MYKSKLQVLCHKKCWSLPVYSSVKDGPDHNPRFRASVSVNAVSFDTPHFSQSSKEAQNEAARIAYDYFTSPENRSELPSIPNKLAGDAFSSLSGLSFVRNELNNKSSNELNNIPGIEGTLLQKNQEISKNPLIHGNAIGVKDEFGDMHLYKNQLQNYAQKRIIGLPIYSFEREGQLHALRFKAKVTIDGHTFESPEYFHTLKEAEHAAAKVALMSLSVDDTQTQVASVRNLLLEPSFYKNLLQELTQKEGFSSPIYNTIRSGASHFPTFSSTVEVKGEMFHGTVAKSKKQAEMYAAKAAYSDLIERKLNRSTESLSLSCQPLEALQCNSSSSNSVLTDDLQQNYKTSGPLVSTLNIGSEDYGEDNNGGDQEADSAKTISFSSKVSTDHSVADLNATVADPNIELPIEMDSWLLCNRFRVYPCMPKMAFPKGISVLPISDDKWVAVSLEFPNEEANGCS